MINLPYDCIRIIYKYYGYDSSYYLRLISRDWYYAYRDFAFHINDSNISIILKANWNVRGFRASVDQYPIPQIHMFESNKHLQLLEITVNDGINYDRCPHDNCAGCSEMDSEALAEEEFSYRDYDIPKECIVNTLEISFIIPDKIDGLNYTMELMNHIKYDNLFITIWEQDTT